MLNKVKHKTKLTQNKKEKHTSNANSKNKKGRERKVTKSLRAFFPSTPWKNLSVQQILDPAVRGEELKPFKFERNIRALRISPRGAKEDGN